MKELLSGDEAIAQAAAEAGVGVASAYPGTPSTEILESIITRVPAIDATWSVNEKTAFETAYGAAVGGVRSLTAMKHVGLNVAADPLLTSAYTGVNAGFVIVVADDPGMFSSQNEQDSRWYARFSKLPLLEPADSQEVLDFTKAAYELSERFDTPVIVRLTTRIAHTKTAVDTNAHAPITGKFTFAKDPKKYVMIPSHAVVRHRMLEERLITLAAYSDDCAFNRIEKGGPLGIITAGVDYQYVKEIFPEASILKLGMVHPLPKKLIASFASSVRECMVIESLDAVIEEQVRAMGISLLPRKHPFTSELSADVLSVYTGKENASASAGGPIPGRPPSLCTGCSHHEVFEILRDLNVIVTGDIGCYTLGTMPPYSAMDTCLCMGASITMASGFTRAQAFGGTKAPIVAVLGDSTFIHTGIPALIDAVYNRTNITVIVLDNYITAMTGHQSNPATGITAKGEKTVRLDLEALGRGVGVSRIVKFNPFKEKEMAKLIRAEIEAAAPSLIIAEAPCIFYRKRFPNGERR
ncbi:MAG: thiamine pyrophosphate-dependent enzyme [Spirochaetota bacterium]